MARNPFQYGWEPGRLDQGWDGKFLVRIESPVWGKVVYSERFDPGWRGGGYIAIARAFHPQEVYYFAEGLIPLHPVGTRVWPGRWIATPRANPYNGIVGNIEWGRANPRVPQQPLAQVVSDPKAMVLAFYREARGWGLPAATSTEHAGFA